MAILNGKGASHNRTPAALRLRALVRLPGLVLSRFLAHGGPERAGSLAYTTLLSLVPLMTVVFAILTAFPVGERVNEVVQEFIFRNFIPAAGEVVHRYLLEFSDKASHLSGVGFVALLLVALLLVHSIDRTFNAIWEVRRRRPLLNKFLVYWAVISLGPLLVGASLVATSYLVSLPAVTEVTAEGLGKRLLEWLPVVMSAMAFGLIYWLVPNRPVKGWHALAGGVFAAILFEWSKQAFAWYLTTFPTYEVVYGALAAIPIFLIWLYLSWLVVLLGAEVTYALEAYRHLFRGGGGRHGELEQLLHLLLLLAGAQRAGKGVSVRPLLRCCADAERLLAELRARRLVERNDRGQWFLARAASEVRLLDLYRVSERRLPMPGEADWPADPALARVLERADACLAEALDLPVEALGTSAD